MEPVLIARENTPQILQLIGEDLKELIDEYPHPDCWFPRVVEDLSTAHRQLWVLSESAVIQGWLVTKIEVHPEGQRTLILDLMGGKEVDVLLAALPTIEAWAANLGASEARAWIRPGLRRKLKAMDFHHKADLVVKPLTGQLH